MFLAGIGFMTASCQADGPFYGVEDRLMGVYEGAWTSQGKTDRARAQIRPLGNNSYNGFVMLNRSQQMVGVFKVEGKVNAQGVLELSGSPTQGRPGGELIPKMSGHATLQHHSLKGTFSGDLGEGSFELQKVNRTSPTLDAQPPAGSVVLFNGKKSDAWKNNDWPVTEEGFLRVGSGNLTTRQQWPDFKLHLEFRTPYMPEARGQQRGNSGVYLQSIYEVQVLDSFGLYPLQINDCGSIYGIQTAAGNACLPPMQWQTYDITFRTGPDDIPVITVKHNGITTISEAKVPQEIVGKGGGGGDPRGGFLMLQDHGNAVEYRNTWAQKLE